MRNIYFLKRIVILIFLAGFSATTPQAIAQTPETVWNKTYGGSQADIARSVIQTSEGNYMIAGYSFSSDGDITENKGSADCWLVLTDPDGNLLWEKNYGGSQWESFKSVTQTSDGGFVAAGFTDSDDGDVTGNDFLFPFGQVWIVKTDESGNILWNKVLGSTLGLEEIRQIIETSDGDYIAVGVASSCGFEGDDVSECFGENDVWINKLDSSGNLLWEKSFGGSETELAESVVETADGDLVVVGFSFSQDNHLTDNKGEADLWVFKIDESGEMIWQKNYGGSAMDWAESVVQDEEGNLIIAGYTSSNDGDVAENNGNYDFWVIKLDSSGNLLWEKTYGDEIDNLATYVITTQDNNYIVAGYKTDESYVSSQWIIKIEPSAGELLWEKTFEGTGLAYSVIQDSNSDLIVAGATYSNEGDFWVVKLREENMGIEETETSSFVVYPNPFSGELNIQLSENVKGNYTFNVTDLSGKTIYTQNQDKKSFVWNGTSLPKGVYVLSIETNGKIIAKKVIKK